MNIKDFFKELWHFHPALRQTVDGAITLLAVILFVCMCLLSLYVIVMYAWWILPISFFLAVAYWAAG